MAKFLTTTAASFYLEELIKNARERLFLISPYWKLNDRLKELLEDKNRMKIDIRIIYGKNDLNPSEMKWFKSLDYVRISYCPNLHAKCYISEQACIITSLNLYEFSQVNNHEMGIFLSKDEDGKIYQDAYEEAQRIIRISEEVKVSLDAVNSGTDGNTAENGSENKNHDKLTTAKLAEKLGISTQECNQKLCDAGLQQSEGKYYSLTDAGKQAGGEIKKGRFGYFIVWDSGLAL
ncbi:Predicted HKD family nuclease [Kingella potus]|uniref:Predicted HKD family nuclease n=1 Tax=Kingella potus TaxID=265175 RepID=A0A377QYC8_9NEIS|nr:phospholipase D family protein [Kingella potus]UOP01304.1 phospholipase D family protein [Kingella potus]STR00384.1 Predicted HKD family nuclease [Kingella potus]